MQDHQDHLSDDDVHRLSKALMVFIAMIPVIVIAAVLYVLLGGFILLIVAMIGVLIAMFFAGIVWGI